VRWLLAALAALLALTFALVVPPWGAPDEPQHYEYVAALARLGRPPTRQDVSLELQARVVESMREHDFWRVGHLPRSAWGVAPTQLDRPPLPYLLYLPAYLAIPGSDHAARLRAMRLVSVLLAAATTLAVAALTARLFPDDPLLRLGPPLLTALTPQAAFVAGSVNSDNLANLIGALAFLALARAVAGPSTWRAWALVAALLLVGGATKRTTLYLVPLAPAGATMVALIALPGRSSRRRPSGVWGRAPTSPTEEDPPASALVQRARRRGLDVVLAAVAAPVALLWAGAATDAPLLLRRLIDRWVANESLEYNLALLTHPSRDWSAATLWGTYSHQARVLFESYWARFGWMNVPLDPPLYAALAALCGAALVGLLLLALGRAPSALRLSQPAARAAWLAAAAAPLALAPIVLQYSLWFTPGSLPQGRYLFTALTPLTVLFALGLAALVPARRRGAATVALAVGLALLNAAALVGRVWPAHYGGAA
jgi:hypothetical protein